MDLTESQRRAVEHDGRNLQLIACAGSGKTEVVARRVVHLLTPGRPGTLEPRNIVAFTFTDKAAAELKERIVARTREALGEIHGMADLFVGTIHAFCLDLLRAEAPEYLKYEVLNEVQQALFVDRHSRKSGLTTSTDLQGRRLKRYVDTNHYVNALAILREADRDESKLDGCSVAAALDGYRDLLRERSYFDYSSILEAAVESLTNDDDLRRRLAERLRYVIVDEYQDVNPIQEGIVWSLHDLGALVCVVGDDDQTIYQWRGSDVRNILTFSDRYPGVDRIRLDDNFRSSEGIVRTARAFIEQNDERLDKAMTPAGRQATETGDVVALAFDIAGVVGREAALFDDLGAAGEERNEFVNDLRGEVRSWRGAGYPGTAVVTRRLLEWWFERDEERRAVGKRLFFCQQEAVETLIHLYEVQRRHKMPGTGTLLRYALKLATGAGKTVVMAAVVVWSTLHKRKVSGSSLSANFLVLVPNLTVRDRVSGTPRGDGLDPAGERNLYDEFEMVPPEYRHEFHPNVLVRNWQAVPLHAKRDDWIGEGEVPVEDGRFVPQSVLRAMRRRARQDPNAPIRRLLKGWRDLVVFNDEAHHVYGEKRTKRGEEPAYIRWSHILDRITKSARLALVVDLSATPWYGSGSPKPEGTLFEWLVSDFSVYDAFESGLVKVVRLPDPKEQGHIYIDLWDQVRGAKTKEEYLIAGRGAVASIYSSWKQDCEDWAQTLPELRGPSPVLLCVTNDATRAKWLFQHLVRDYDLLRNEGDDPARWTTIQIDSKVFDADRGREAVLREMVNTVGSTNRPGEHVRCIFSVDMLSEGWDVKSITHILGLRAFGSPLLTEQIVGRGLRRTNYDVLNRPLDQRPEGYEETVDAFGIPFVGFPVQRRKRPRTGQWGQKPVWVEPVEQKAANRVRVPNVRSWAVGVTEPLADLIEVHSLPQIEIDPKQTPPDVNAKPVVGGRPEEVMTLDQFRGEWPMLRTAFQVGQDLHEATNPGSTSELGVGPTFEELLDLAQRYLDHRTRTLPGADPRDVGVYFWRRQVVDVLETAVRGAGAGRTAAVPMLGSPEWLDTSRLRRFRWTGLVAAGRKCHTNKAPCHTELERQFADFLDRSKDVVRWFKNERLGFSVTYYEGNRPRQYHPDFLITVREADGREILWVIETKGEIRPNTKLKSEAAELWCQRMSTTRYGSWRYLFVQQKRFEMALDAGVRSLAELQRRRPGTSEMARRSSRRAGSKRPASEGWTSACSSVVPWDDRWNRRFGTGTTSCSVRDRLERARGR